MSYGEAAVRIGALIRKYRELRGMTQAQLSAALNAVLDQGAISNIELCKRVVSFPESVLFIDVLDIPVEEMHAAFNAELDAAIQEVRPASPKRLVRKRLDEPRLRSRASGDR